MSNLRTAEGTAPNPRWTALRDRLETIKRPIFAEIRDYPPQVAGCDLHFRDLSEKRDAICRELDRLDSLWSASDQELEAFEATSAFLSGSDTPADSISPPTQGTKESNDVIRGD